MTIISNINIKDLVNFYISDKIKLPADLAGISIGEWDVSNVTSMKKLFQYKHFNENIGEWDVSNVTSMEELFNQCYNFNQDISKWNVSKVTNIYQMFRDCDNFNQDIGNWKVNNVTNMAGLFNNCSNFNQDIGNWDVSKVTNIDQMFRDCSNFNQYIGNWKVNNVTNMAGLFNNCSNFNQDIGNWDVSNVTNMNKMFLDCSNFNQDLSRWDISNVTSMNGMFGNCPIIEAYIPVKNNDLVQKAEKAFSGTLGGILELLVIHPDDTFGNNNCTFGAIVELLAPNITNASGAHSMAIHTLSRKLNLSLIFQTFIDCVGSDVIKDDFNSSSTKTKLELSAILLYNLIKLNLSIHNADENADSWTHIYDNIANTKKLINHAIFNVHEGLMKHPRFESHPEQLLYIVKFIELLPQQIQVAWAKFYIKEFIEGYGQKLETFDPIKKSQGCIASCINGNFEKLLLSISTAITQFYPSGWGLEPVTDENDLLKAAITGSEFEKYYSTTAVDINGPTLEGYRKYIKGLVNAELREKYLNLLTDQEVVNSIQGIIDLMSGGKSGRFNKHNKTFKRKSKKTIKKKKLYKRKKTFKKYKLYKRKKTHKE
jgi:surface protein